MGGWVDPRVCVGVLVHVFLGAVLKGEPKWCVRVQVGIWVADPVCVCVRVCARVCVFGLKNVCVCVCVCVWSVFGTQGSKARSRGQYVVCHSHTHWHKESEVCERVTSWLRRTNVPDSLYDGQVLRSSAELVNIVRVRARH